MVTLVPKKGGEKESLRASLQRHRDAVRWKLQGLDDEQLRRRMTPSGTHLLGLVKHLATVEYGWFCLPFGRESKAQPWDPKDPEFDMRVEPGETAADIIAFYRQACVDADAVINAVDIEELGVSWEGEDVTMRWILIHMIEETARHAGHMDLMRELIDGRTGDHPWEEEPQGS
jgi:uncharacterized damage-inducible protein DinB